VPFASGAPGNNALIYNLSERGLLLESAAAVSVGDVLVVDMPEAGAVSAEVVWVREAFAGCEFDRPLSNAAVSAALLRSLPQPRSSVAENVPAIAQSSETDRDADPQWVRALAILSLLAASGVAILFIFALLKAPFSAG
jgi:hypothetical protein